jgi:hypothetical protein
MSKRLKNYPEPGIVIDKFGADALRLYLINSPVVRAETLKFKEEGVKEIIARVFLPWYNAFKFFVTQSHVLKKVRKSYLFFLPMCYVSITMLIEICRISTLSFCTRQMPRNPRTSWIVGFLLHVNPLSSSSEKRWLHTDCTLLFQDC